MAEGDIITHVPSAVELRAYHDVEPINLSKHEVAFVDTTAEQDPQAFGLPREQGSDRLRYRFAVVGVIRPEPGDDSRLLLVKSTNSRTNETSLHLVTNPNGPLESDRAERWEELKEGVPVTVGRKPKEGHPSAQLVNGAFSGQVSRNHFKAEALPGGSVAVTDTSLNGTKVEAVLKEPQTPDELRVALEGVEAQRQTVLKDLSEQDQKNLWNYYFGIANMREPGISDAQHDGYNQHAGEAQRALSSEGRAVADAYVALLDRQSQLNDLLFAVRAEKPAVV